jgi:cytochrome c oxidase accessory protein FixG
MSVEQRTTPGTDAAAAFHAEQQNEHVLSTLNRDGSRHWINPRPSKGRFLTGRRATAYGLIALFTLLPYVQVRGKPALLLDVAHRRFTCLGVTFLPTDTLLLMLLLVIVFVTVFMVTAVFGRVWCGWACPQTVYMEFVYRPLERLLEGRKGPDGKAAPGRKILKYAAYLVLSMFLAHTFLAYFVGVDRLAEWVQRSPFEHPSSFFLMAGVTAMMMFDFCFFREQMCIVACPYGRFQSVMLDRQSLLVSYDRRRGEPRGKMRRKAAPAAVAVELRVLPEEPALGDCIDCRMCVQTCPTGIDIRNGLQMECIACAQCIDACDSIMDKVGRPRGLIRYSSQARMDGERRRVVRPRLALYLLVLSVLGSLFGYTLATRSPVDLSVLRAPGLPFNKLPDGSITNQLKVKVTNRTDASRQYTVSIDEPGVRIELADNPVQVKGGASLTTPVLVIVDAGAFSDGHKDVRVRITADDGATQAREVRLLGPFGAAAAPHVTETPEHHEGDEDEHAH